jgi:triphosphatase
VNTETAFKALAQACLHQIISNREALQHGDMETVHQMRVGLRRLRAAIALFSDMLNGSQTEAMKSELKWLTEELGPAREADVFIKRLVRLDKRQMANQPGLTPVVQDFRKQRVHALTRAERAVGSTRYRRLVLDAAAWIEAGDWTQNNHRDRRALRAMMGCRYGRARAPCP